MKLRVEVNGQSGTLHLQWNASDAAYALTGFATAQGKASIQPVGAGVFSVLLNERSVVVHVLPHSEGAEVWVGLNRYVVALADPRDKAATSAKASAQGPAELRAQMPGKIIKVLVAPGDAIKAGQGLIVVEAMKMQNEVKSPKDGTVSKIQVAEGATVGAGDLLLVVS